MPKFTHLHVHTHYSLLDGLPTIDKLVSHTKKMGMDSVAITDHGTMYGAIEFYKKAKSAGIKPIIGEEFYVAFEGMEQRRPNVDDKRYHLILLAKNFTGYQNLVKLTTKAWLDGFYYKPRIDEKFLRKCSKGLICMTACMQGKIPRFILSGKNEEAEKLAIEYKNLFDEGDFYLELQSHPGSPEQKKINENLIYLSKKLGIPLVATNDIHYLEKDDAEAQDILMLINTNAKPNDPERLSMKDIDLSFKSQKEMEEAFSEAPESIENTQKIAEKCNLKIEIGKIKLPIFQANGETPDKQLTKLSTEGLKKRYNGNITDQMEERLDFELSVIKKTGFASYFLIVQDFVNWAKKNEIVVGPGRGSAAGSLVSYCLGITNIDPIKYELLFERFLNPERISMPDIDLDFADTRREEVIEYVSQKHGKGNVAQIITFGTMAARQVIRDVGRVLEYEYGYCDKAAKMIPMFTTLDEALQKVDEFSDFYNNDPRAKKMIDIGKKLEGVARHASTHACGVVISNDPLINLIPTQRASQNDETLITQYEMHSIEDLGLLKMDFLGLKNLTIIENSLKLIKAIHNTDINISKIPLDDKESFSLFQKAGTTGVFQLESDGMKRYLKDLKPTEFEDIIAMVALFRPGPMELIPDYIQRKHGKKQVTYLHPKLEEILKSTFGICVYQEQLMQIAQKLAGFSLAEADILRKAVGKKIEDLLLEQQKKMTAGMIKNGIDGKTAREIWNWILPFARYGFNKSHATAYAMIAYQTAYLKSHFPVEFMAVLMNNEQKNIDKLKVMLEEAKKMSIEVLPPDINESRGKFTVIEKQKIRFGLNAIKNVGQNIVEKIVQERDNKESFKSIENFIERVSSEVSNKKSLESLIKAGSFDSLEDRGKLFLNIDKILEFGRSFHKNKKNCDGSLFGGAIALPGLRLEESKTPVTENEKITWEKELLGVFVSSHPLLNIKKDISKAFPINEIKSNSSLRYVKIAGVISKIKKINTRNGENMLFLTVEDLTGDIEIVVFPKIFKNNPGIFLENKIVGIRGKISNKDSVAKIICEEIAELK